jgi:hypothetical protein
MSSAMAALVEAGKIDDIELVLGRSGLEGSEVIDDVLAIVPGSDPGDHVVAGPNIRRNGGGAEQGREAER